jgi:hypothetical protein
MASLVRTGILRPPGIQHYPLIQSFLTLFTPSTGWHSCCLGDIRYSISEAHSFFQEGDFDSDRFSGLIGILGEIYLHVKRVHPRGCIAQCRFTR